MVRNLARGFDPDLKILNLIMEGENQDQNNQASPNHLNPLRTITLSGFVMHIEHIIIKPHTVPLLLIFKGMDNKNRYTHNKNVEEICFTFHDVNMLLDLMRMKICPLTLNDRAKMWFNTVRLRSIRSWNDLWLLFGDPSSNKSFSVVMKILIESANQSYH